MTVIKSQTKGQYGPELIWNFGIVAHVKAHTK